jgi:hypothetical protein
MRDSGLNWLWGRQLGVDVKLGHTQAKAGMRPADGYFNSLLSNEEMLRLGVLGRPDPEMRMLRFWALTRIVEAIPVVWLILPVNQSLYDNPRLINSQL